MGRTKADYNWQNTGRQVFYDGHTFETLMPMGFPVVFFDDFLKPATDATNDWTEATEGTSNAQDITARVNGFYEIDTGTAADKRTEISTALAWEAAQSCGCEVKVETKTSDASLFMNFGFTDVATEGAAKISFKDASLATGTVDAWASDAVMFGVRAETSDDIYALSTIADGVPQSTDTGTDLVLATSHIYRIQLDSLGNARYFIDGALVAEHLLAVTTTDDLCFTLAGLITAGSTAAFIDIDYVKIWQNRQ